jgi:hypothetical protein
MQNSYKDDRRNLKERRTLAMGRPWAVAGFFVPLPSPLVLPLRSSAATLEPFFALLKTTNNP